MIKNLTSRDFFRIHAYEALEPGIAALTQEQRYQQAVMAKRTRNFWFTSTLMPVTTGTPLAGVGGHVYSSQTPRFSLPLVLTDMLSLYEPGRLSGVGPAFVQITQYGGEGGSGVGQNFFGAYSPLVTWLTLKHERDRQFMLIFAGAVVNSSPFDKHIGFLPHLLRPYEVLRAQYAIANVQSPNDAPFPHLGLRAVRALLPSDPYAHLTPLADKQVRSYIAGNSPETFYFELKTTIAKLGAISTGFVDLRTEQFDRPLLILGAASNVMGVRTRIVEEGSFYQFTFQEKPDSSFSAGAAYQDPPLSIVAPDTDFRNTNLFNMWPVPHMLEPGAVLRVRLLNGCFPTTGTAVLRQAAATRGGQDVRVTFICRTV